ncbi:MAG: 50S ribosomal protein L13 [Nanoarchaeales archaeon]|nr:50S ribosomal protein L13 [Nanoarchaeales archaeon]
MANEVKEEKFVVIDGTDLIMGRLGSTIAKRLLMGESFKIVNCKDVVILGRKSFLVQRYKNKISNKVTKQGPYYSRSPSDIVKRAFRNMLPYKNERGAAAFRRLKCYNSTPSTLISADKETLEKATLNNDEVFYFTRIGELSKALGYVKE